MIYYTRISNINFYQEDDKEKVISDEFNFSDKIIKKYSSENGLGIRSIISYLTGNFNEDELWKIYNINPENLKKIRKIQDYIKVSHNNYDLIPKEIILEFGLEYLDLIKNCYNEYKEEVKFLNLQALINFDKTKIILEKLIFSHPYLLNNSLENYKNYIYKINRYSFLRVNYTQGENGLIYSYDRCLSNIAKNDKIKNFITSRFGKNGKIITVDYNAFHPRIIFSLSGYELNEDKLDFYEFLKNNLSLGDITRNDLKLLLFQIFYGNLNSKEIKIKFEKIFLLKDKLNQEYNQKKYISSITGRRKFLKPEEIKTKLLNSYIQMTHSEIINEMLCKIDDFLKSKRSKLIGIISDSFLFDVVNNENEEIKEFLKNNLQSSQFLQKCFLKLKLKEGNSWAECSS